MSDRASHKLRLLCVTIALCAASVKSAQAQNYPYNAPANPFGTTPQPTLPPSSGLTPLAQPYTQPLAQPWDPYAAGAASAPPPALPPYSAPGLGTTPYGSPPAYPTTPTAPNTGLGYPFQDWTAPSTKLVQHVSIRNSWLARDSGNNGFGMTNVDLAASLAFPFFFNLNQTPLIFTPGFNFHFLQGPVTGNTQNLPGTVYDAFGQLSWQPVFGQQKRLGADLAVSVGVYTDFQYVDHTSIRILGRGLGTWVFNPQWKAALGVVYLDRLQVKILPAGGFIWTPTNDARFELLFPSPKLAQRITNYGNSEIWGYIGGEYGGGQWSIEHQNGGTHDVFNYNDIRLFLGVETFGIRNVRGYFEVGWVFNREIIYHNNGVPVINPDDTVMLRGGVSF